MNNEKGLTLIEILAALAILSVVSMLIMGIFVQGTKFTNEKVTENQLTQEANFIVTQLKRVHRQSQSYKVTDQDCDIYIDEQNITTNQPNFCYEISNFKNQENVDVKGVKIDPKSEQNHALSLDLTVKEKNNPKNAVKIHVQLFRLKEL